jgi:2-polyprenyl-3-methyl-5-hydroxy-6-metoxy-1,4-benzoquinol methylase
VAAPLTCLVCGSLVTQPLFKGVRLRRDATHANGYLITHSRRDFVGAIVRCDGCGTGYLPPDLARQATARYAEAADPSYADEAPERIRNADRLLALLPGGSGGELLEIGSACGFLLEAARRRGFRVHGIEPSRWAVDEARRRFGFEIHCGTDATADVPAQSVDVAVMADVIEHLPAPHVTLARLATWLRPGGLLLILTPDLDSLVARYAGRFWWGLLDDHCVYFTRASLRTLLAGQGFQTEPTHSFGRSFNLGRWVSKLSQYNAALHRVMAGAVRACDLAAIPVYINVGDQMVCVARRR